MTTLANTYADQYLCRLVTPDIEARAAAHVASLGTFPPAHVAALQVLRAYVITCLESMKTPEDLFSAKLAAYRKEYDAALSQARTAQAAADAVGGEGAVLAGGSSFFTVELVRA